tara:strand:+ start:1292 stop:2110 length:819 start_codon:yes stop_codon:yes gene_type:complete
MTLPSSGQITMNQIHVEAGGSSGSQAALNDADIRALIGKGSTSQNAFNEYYGVSAAAPTGTYKGYTITTGNGFPSGYVNLSSGTKIVVVTLQLAGPNNTYVSLGGTNMTLAAKVDTVSPNANVWQLAPTSAVYYLVTSASGSTSVVGNGGSGRSVAHIWEITGYNSSTPTATATAQNTDASSYSKTISISTQYNGITIGSGICEDTIPTGSVTVSNSDSLQQIDLESATNHYSWRDQGTSLGTTSYNCDQNNPGSNIVSGSTPQQLAAAHWK